MAKGKKNQFAGESFEKIGSKKHSGGDKRQKGGKPADSKPKDRDIVPDATKKVEKLRDDFALLRQEIAKKNAGQLSEKEIADLEVMLKEFEDEKKQLRDILREQFPSLSDEALDERVTGMIEGIKDKPAVETGKEAEQTSKEAEPKEEKEKKNAEKIGTHKSKPAKPKAVTKLPPKEAETFAADEKILARKEQLLRELKKLYWEEVFPRLKKRVLETGEQRRKVEIIKRKLKNECQMDNKKLGPIIQELERKYDGIQGKLPELEEKKNALIKAEQERYQKWFASNDNPNLRKNDNEALEKYRAAFRDFINILREVKPFLYEGELHREAEEISYSAIKERVESQKAEAESKKLNVRKTLAKKKELEDSYYLAEKTRQGYIGKNEEVPKEVTQNLEGLKNKIYANLRELGFKEEKIPAEFERIKISIEESVKKGLQAPTKERKGVVNYEEEQEKFIKTKGELWQKLIEAHQRYFELLESRGQRVRVEEQDRGAKRFSEDFKGISKETSEVQNLEAAQNEIFNCFKNEGFNSEQASTLTGRLNRAAKLFVFGKFKKKQAAIGKEVKLLSKEKYDELEKEYLAKEIYRQVAIRRGDSASAKNLNSELSGTLYRRLYEHYLDANKGDEKIAREETGKRIKALQEQAKERLAAKPEPSVPEPKEKPLSEAERLERDLKEIKPIIEERWKLILANPEFADLKADTKQLILRDKVKKILELLRAEFSKK